MVTHHTCLYFRSTNSSRILITLPHAARHNRSRPVRGLPTPRAILHRPLPQDHSRSPPPPPPHQDSRPPSHPPPHLQLVSLVPSLLPPPSLQLLPPVAPG